MTLHSMPQQAQEKFILLSHRMMVMKHHPVFSAVNTLEDLRTFMEWHVFAVWDFMSLVKRLQSDFTQHSLPWQPPRHARAARLINEIVLGEESDETPGGGNSSHFELYLQAMKEVGARTDSIERFIDLIRYGMTVEGALQQVGAPPQVATFVQSTIHTACEEATSNVLGSFFYGREDIIPVMFRHLLDNWTVEPKQAPTFVYYLERHIELDGDSHGPATRRIIEELLGNDEQDWSAMLDAAQAAVEQRIALWDALQATLQRQKMPVHHAAVTQKKSAIA